MSAHTFSDCRYSAFFSYAHADDTAWRRWVTHFCYEFEMGLGAVLHGVTLPKVHLSGKNGPINGPLNDALRRNIEDSFAMVVFVHDGYLHSQWCLQEIQHFRELFGDEGFRHRLFIVAMSRPAIEDLCRRPSWRELFPAGDQVWMPFFQPDDDERPLDVYAQIRRDNAIVSDAFWDKFEPLRRRLRDIIRAALSAEQQAQSFPSVRAADGVCLGLLSGQVE